MPSTYLKLIDRGYGNHNQSMMDKNPNMMNDLMIQMASDDKVMSHWHSMMQQNPKLIMQTMDDWVLQMKDNPELLQNILSPEFFYPIKLNKVKESRCEHLNRHPRY